MPVFEKFHFFLFCFLISFWLLLNGVFLYQNLNVFYFFGCISYIFLCHVPIFFFFVFSVFCFILVMAHRLDTRYNSTDTFVFKNFCYAWIMCRQDSKFYSILYCTVLFCCFSRIQAVSTRASKKIFKKKKQKKNIFFFVFWTSRHFGQSYLIWWFKNICCYNILWLLLLFNDIVFENGRPFDMRQLQGYKPSPYRI